MLQEINKISQFQSNPTRNSDEKSKMLLDNTATYPDTIICYKAI